MPGTFCATSADAFDQPDRVLRRQQVYSPPGDGADYNLNGRTNVGYFPGCDDDPVTKQPNAVCVANNGLTPKQRTPFYGRSTAYPNNPAPFPHGLGRQLRLDGR